jgi:hypothetical protein
LINARRGMLLEETLSSALPPEGVFIAIESTIADK